MTDEQSAPPDPTPKGRRPLTPGERGCAVLLAIILIPTCILLWAGLADKGTSTPTASLNSCQRAFATASAIDEYSDTVSDLDPAVRNCSLHGWRAAATEYPGALSTKDVELFVANRCLHEPSLANSPICAEVKPLFPDMFP